METAEIQQIKNRLNTIFDHASSNNFCGGVECQNCPLFEQGKKCVSNKIQAVCKKGLTDLITQIEENDKCSHTTGNGGGEA